MKKTIMSICCVLCGIVLTICGVTQTSLCYAETSLNIACKACLLMDFSTGEVLYEQNIDEKLQVASMFKLMTILITMEEIENGKLTLDQTFTASENAASMGGSQLFIDPFEEYKIEDMLKGAIVSSANDGCVALSEVISGSEDAFVNCMNKKAKELKLDNTLYANSTGLPDPNQYSTARDVSNLLSEVLKHDLYFNYSTIWMDYLTHPSGRQTEVVNTNKLTRYYEGCDAGKTGSLSEAGYCLTASAKRNDLRIIATVIGCDNSQSRFNETAKLLNFGFANFSNQCLLSKNNVIATIKVYKGKEQSVDIVAKEDFFGLCPKNETNEYEVSYEYADSINAPFDVQTKVGVAIITKNGVVIKEIDLVTKEGIGAISYKDCMKRLASNW